MNGVLTLLSLLICGFIVFAVPPLVAPYVGDYGPVTSFDVSKAILLMCLLATAFAVFIYKQSVNRSFLLKLFVSALLIRMVLASLIFSFRAQDFFGGDALTYDYFGFAQVQAWYGDKLFQFEVDRFVGGGVGFGMVYMVAAVYGLIGRNMLAVQFVNSVLGAATAPVIFLCAHQVFNNLRVARWAAIAVAFYPSLVLWSSQGLKDGPIVFFLAFSILATLKLGQKLSLKYLIALVCSLFLLLSFRFYVFYMLSVAIAGAFLIGMQTLSARSFVRQFVVIIAVGLGLTYLGVTRYASTQIEQFGSLERIQRSRLDLATSAQSGFGKDVDVSTESGALATIPLGLVYLLFAPFPWQLVSLRQSLTLPEMTVWWLSVPLLVLGLWFAIRYRLREVSPILLFTSMLTLAYSVFQGNVGTAYRQRSQLLVFYFIFVAVGGVLIMEKMEDRKRQRERAKQELAERRASRVLARRQSFGMSE